jgi:hypothetical protein
MIIQRSEAARTERARSLGGYDSVKLLMIFTTVGSLCAFSPNDPTMIR